MKLITKEAIQDVIDGAKNYEFWMTFGMNDIKAKYRRSKLGQLWITLSVAVFILMIGTLYGGFFKHDGGKYVSFLAVGYISWLFMSECINTGCMAFASTKPFILQRNWPFSTFIYRIVYREILVFAHLAILIPPIFMIDKVLPSALGIFVSFLGMFLCVYTAFWVAMILAIVTLRYRDMPPIIASLMRMAFFISPILWSGRNFGAVGSWIAAINPFGYFLEIVRAPLLGESLAPMIWLVAIIISALVTFIGLATLTATKNKLTYWL